MVRETAIGLFVVLVLLAAAQYLLLRVFLRALRRVGGDSPGADGPLPKAVVVVCLRGGDPFLADCLRAVFDQDYPAYEVHVVVDSRDDPAWATVEQVIAETGAEHVRVSPLDQRRETCSLKCSSLVQAISRLDDSVRVVAQVDADAAPHRTWLKELVAPLADERVGAATGNRWYMPAQFSWAALVRYLWNAAAVPQMCTFHIPWGGTLAIKREVFQRSDLLERWGNAFCEDTMVYSALKRLGLEVVFVPSLVMVNREDCSLRGYVQWLRRQLLAARLYHPYWWFTVMHALVTSLIWVAALGVGLWGVAAEDLVATSWAVAGAAAYIAIMLTYLPIIELAVRRVVRWRGEPTRWMSLRFLLAIPAAGVLLQMVYPSTLISAMRLKRTRWRGIDYRVDGPWQVRMIEYRPFGTGEDSQRKLSL